jgi:acyl dehydratase
MDVTVLPVRPASFEDLQALIGVEIGPTPWYDMTQERISAFADATGDHQWIHVDTERAAAGPFGTTIAHGLFTLALGPSFTMQLLSFSGFSAGLNYGYDKIRFPAPLPSGSRIRMRLTGQSAERVPGGIQFRSLQVVEAEGIAKPIVVAGSLSRIVELERVEGRRPALQEAGHALGRVGMAEARDHQLVRALDGGGQVGVHGPLDLVLDDAHRVR